MTERSNIDEAALDEALAWQAALEDGSADWDAYIAWLEASPVHRDAFNAVDLVEATVAEHRGEIRAVRAVPPPTPGLWRRLSRPFGMAGSAVAAALALFFVAPALWAPPSARTFATEAGERRVLALAGGVNVTLSPASMVVVHGEDAARIVLTRGEAYFDVRHDPARTLIVEAAGYSISDIGTRFSVNSAGGALRVGVAEGAVMVGRPEADKPLHVSAGHQLISRGDKLMISAVNISDVASWRMGRLSYSNAPLSLVAADISRYSGTSIFIDPSLEATHFSGSLVIGDGTKLLAELAAAIEARVRQEGDRAWLAAPSDS